MTPGAYNIVRYRPEHQDGVLAVLAGLIPVERALLARFFHWRYLENPYATDVLGVVALHGGQPVGFRGYFAGGFTAGEPGNNVDVLYPCDTIVAVEHRNRGLSVAMGRFASEFGEAGYRFFLNFTSSRSSRPAYRSLGFEPLATRVLLQRDGWNPLRWLVCAWSKHQYGRGHRFVRGRVRFGRFGDILVTDAPRAEDMAAIIAAEPRDGEALRLRQDTTFFAWRYRNPVRRYAFYFRMDGEVARAHLVIGVSPDGRSGRVLDYGEAREGALREALRYVCTSGEFVALSAFGYGLDARLGYLIREFRFMPVHTPQTLFKRGSVEELAPSVLFRPVAKSYGDEAFRIGALDLRKPEHWRLKPICSDGA